MIEFLVVILTPKLDKAPPNLEHSLCERDWRSRRVIGNRDEVLSQSGDGCYFARWLVT